MKGRDVWCNYLLGCLSSFLVATPAITLAEDIPHLIQIVTAKENDCGLCDISFEIAQNLHADNVHGSTLQCFTTFLTLYGPVNLRKSK